MLGELPGGNTSLYDYFWDVDELKWIPWTTKVPKYVHAHDMKFNQILVPTVDTVRTMWLLAMQVTFSQEYYYYYYCYWNFMVRTDRRSPTATCMHIYRYECIF